MKRETTTPCTSTAPSAIEPRVRCECGSGPTRELAQRLSGKAEVLIAWNPELDCVELSVRDLATGAGFHFEVEPDDAIDAFYHPYAYAATRGDSYRVDRDETSIFDG